MVSHRLIFGTGVARPQVKHLVVRCIRPRTERDTDESRISHTWRSGQFQSDVGLDGSILKICSRQYGETVFKGVLTQADRFASFVLDCLRLDFDGRESGGVLKRKCLV